MAKKPLNIGMIGYGFMGRAHSNAYRRVNHFFDLEYRPVLKAVCARNAEKLKAFADKWGYESIETDWRKLIERKDIDAIDICTPNNMHTEIALAAAEAGKMILCEKPLAMNMAEGEEMVEAVEKAGVPNIVWYNYRRVPAVTLAKQLIDEGRLGRIFHYRANFLQDWTISRRPAAGRAGPSGGSTRTPPAPASPATCSPTASTRPSGSTARSPRSSAMTETFVKERKHNLDRQGRAGRHRRRLRVPLPLRQRLARPVRVDPLRPRPQGALHFEINGENASIKWDLHDLHRLQYFDHDDERATCAAGGRSTSPTATIRT